MLIFSVFAVVQGLTHFQIMTIAGIVGIVYSVWSIGHFFDKKKTVNYVKALVSYLLGMITFWFFVFLIGALYDLVTKH